MIADVHGKAHALREARPMRLPMRDGRTRSAPPWRLHAAPLATRRAPHPLCHERAGYEKRLSFSEEAFGELMLVPATCD